MQFYHEKAMINEFNTGYQYDRCASRGICSINPATSSLQEIIIIYLKYISFYGLKLKEGGIKNKCIHNLVLNTISVLSSNYEISKNDFDMIISAFQKELPKIIEEYKTLCKEKNVEPELINISLDFNKNIQLSDYIRLGEKEFNKRIKDLSDDIRNLYRMLFIVVKSFCINILTFESYGGILEDEVTKVMETFNLLNSSEKNKEELKNFLLSLSSADCSLMEKIKNIREQNYGEPYETDVSFSTTKGKAILVVGSNLKELEQILDKTKDKNIDIYTHDNMIVAHTFPKFKEYKNLKGQYGQGMENCLLDFSTFPGPVILTRHSLFNIENLYRGRLFTTDFAYSKGVIHIKNDDFSEVIRSAEEATGFKTGRKCESEKVGFSYFETLEKIKSKLKTNKYSQIFVIGIQGYSNEEKDYLKNLIKHVPENVLTVSLPCCESKENLVCLNSNYDAYTMYKISKDIINLSKQKVTLFFPYCGRHTLSVMVKLHENKDVDIYFSSWNQTILNPNIIETLKTDFKMKNMTTPKKDLDKILKP